MPFMNKFFLIAVFTTVYGMMFQARHWFESSTVASLPVRKNALTLTNNEMIILAFGADVGIFKEI